MRLSRRELPEADASFDGIADRERAQLVEVWSRRADAELGASNNFRVVVDALRERDAEPELQALAARAIEDEEHHARLCHRLASLFAGRELPAPQAPAWRVPALVGAPAEVRPTLHVIGQCLLNETTASAFLERCHDGAKSSPVRFVLKALLADDIDHARIGWAHLASPRLSPNHRAAVGAWLPALIRANAQMWDERAPIPFNPVLESNGCPSLAETAASVRSALTEVILPGLARLGFVIR